MSDVARRLPGARLTPQQLARSRVLAGLAAFCLILLLLVFTIETLARVGVPHPILVWLIVGFALGAPAIAAVSARTMSTRIFAVAARQVDVADNAMASVVALAGSVFTAGLAARALYSEAEASALAIGLCAGISIGGVLLVPYARRSAATSIGDFLAARFGGRLLPGLAGVVTIAALAPMLVAELSLAGLIGQAQLGLGRGAAIAAAATLMVLPALLGGMRGVTIAAALQFILIFTTLAAASIFISQSVTGSALPLIGYVEAIAIARQAGATGPLPSAWQFAGLGFCVALGVAALPTLLARAATTPSSRAARTSTAWTLLFVALLCAASASIAAIASRLGGTIEPETVLFSAAERAGAPTFVAMVLTAGCLAAALAAGALLLLTAARAFGHDVLFRFMLPRLPMSLRLLAQRAALVAGAVLAANVALDPPADYVKLALTSLSISASGLFPVMVLAVWWRRANRAGALAGMFVGLTISGYVAWASLFDARLFDWLDAAGLKAVALSLGIERIALIAAPAAFAAAALLSLATRAPSAEQRAFAEALFSPRDVVADD